MIFRGCSVPSTHDAGVHDENLDPDHVEASSITRRAFLLAATALPVLGGRASARAAASPPKAKFIARGARTSNQVALTFHGAGDPALTRRVLEITRKAKAPITVFAVGTWVEANHALIRGLADAGHELANHTYSHPALRRLGRQAVAQEISKGADALQAVSGTIGTFFRPSGTPTPTDLMRQEAAKVGYTTVVGYDVDPRDYQDPGTKAVVSRTLSGAKGGSIISLHLGHVGTVDALDQIVAGLRKKGLDPVTVSTLLHS